MIPIMSKILDLKELVEGMRQCQIEIFSDTFSWILFLKFLADVRHINLYDKILP